MCGICGFTGKMDEFVIKKMTNSIIHRGPDEDGFYYDGKINLGIRRLSIVDLTTGSQPVHNENKTLWTVFNGEIYNFQSLRRDLEEKGHRFYTDHSDTEVIVHLYEEYGHEFVQKINGMFAIALWDKIEEKLFLFRDRMGVKPLFYTIADNNIIFGSEIKAILSHPSYSKEINHEALYHYFTFKHIPAPLTAFKGICSLLPGEMLFFSKGEVKKTRWWKIRFEESALYNNDDVLISEQILSLLGDSVRLRMICDVPFGAYLSGGVDSSTIVSLMTRFSSKPIKTFTLGYEDELKNKEADIYYARKVSQAFKTEHYEYIMSHNELTNEIENVIGAFDQPFSGTISTYFLTRLISKHVKVALSGDGADELFGSYLSHRAAQPMYYFNKLYEKIKSNSLTIEEKELFAPCDIKFLDDLFQKSAGNESRWRYCLYLFSDAEKERLLSERFKSYLKEVNTYHLVETYFKDLTAKDPLNRILEMEWNTQLPDQVLAFVDFLSMAHSVEIRSPFLDYRLVELSTQIHGNIKIRYGNVKDILKKTVEPFLPEGITKRPKEGFVLPIFNWMAEKLKSYSMDMLSKERLNKHGLLNIDAVNHILTGHNPAKIWNLMMFQVWWEKYFG